MAVFRFIGEPEARAIPFGSTVELASGGHVTPLALDTLRANRVTVVAAGSIDRQLPNDLAPVERISRVAIGADHTGVAMKATLLAHLRRTGHAVEDVGTLGSEPVDYPDIAKRVGQAVSRHEADAGILIDGSGLGSAIATNKIRNVRAAMCQSLTVARYAREHVGSNVLTLGATLVTTPEAIAIVDLWLSTPMREPRYLRRLIKVRDLEQEW